MADLLAKQPASWRTKQLSLTRGQEIEGKVVIISPQEVVLDLGTKSEGVLSKKDLTPEQLANLHVGDKLLVFVAQEENESGQAIVDMQRSIQSQGTTSERWKKFGEALKENKSLKGKGIEVNKGGLIVEVDGIRGFLPSSQVSLAQAAKLEELIGKTIDVAVIEVEPYQNRLIFSQKTTVSEDVKNELTKLKIGDKVKGEVAAVLPFGIFVTLEGQALSFIEGLVHISEISWEKQESPDSQFKVGDKVEAKVISIDANTGRVNLSIKQLTKDPFLEKAEKFQPEDIVEGAILKVTASGVFVDLKGVEGIVHSGKLDGTKEYEVGGIATFLVDSVDKAKRRINLAPFITSTKGLIYK